MKQDVVEGCGLGLLLAVFSTRARWGERMRILAEVNPPEAIRKILDCLGLSSRPPPVARALRADVWKDC